jgi:ABC-type amino acid transport substrate-binding protein
MDVNASRVKNFDMTQPYFISSIGVAIPYLNRSPLAVFVSNIFSLAFLEIIFLLIFIIFVFGFFLWLIERRHNKFQFRPGLLGLFDGLWWSAVTMTTVGYGDKAPKSNMGKAIAIIWMFTAVIIISSFTAGIASTLTITGLQTDIKNAEDIRLVENISVVGATNGESYLVQENIPINKTYASPILALRALAKKENDVFLYDRTILQYYINRLSLDEKVNLLPFTLKEHYQSFMLPKNHPAFDLINVGLMQEIQKERWGDLQRKYDVKAK